MRYAREHNLGKIILGRPASRRWWRRETFADRLARIAPRSRSGCWSRLMNHPPARLTTRRIAALLKTSGGYRFRGCVVAAALCAVITLIAMQWLMAFDAANPGDAVSTWRGGGGAILWTLAFGGCYRH
ncbi:hypothetical protein HTY54_02895 [Escherichia coli]|nr:hypothetical protein [Escherichia coli]